MNGCMRCTFINGDGELVEYLKYTSESGESVDRFTTFQNNGRTRINELYEDGTATETFESQEAR